MYDVAIIGVGVVVDMIARTLSAYNLNICICLYFLRIVKPPMVVVLILP